jgi:TRAP-type C4-dicarboxylate transport system permease large subunit
MAEEALVWFGVILVAVTEIIPSAPPVGLNVFALKGVLGDKGAPPLFGSPTSLGFSFWF